jgi:hypothetical protein
MSKRKQRGPYVFGDAGVSEPLHSVRGPVAVPERVCEYLRQRKLRQDIGWHLRRLELQEWEQPHRRLAWIEATGVQPPQKATPPPEIEVAVSAVQHPHTRLESKERSHSPNRKPTARLPPGRVSLRSTAKTSLFGYTTRSSHRGFAREKVT